MTRIGCLLCLHLLATTPLGGEMRRLDLRKARQIMKNAGVNEKAKASDVQVTQDPAGASADEDHSKESREVSGQADALPEEDEQNPAILEEKKEKKEAVEQRGPTDIQAERAGQGLGQFISRVKAGLKAERDAQAERDLLEANYWRGSSEDPLNICGEISPGDPDFVATQKQFQEDAKACYYQSDADHYLSKDHLEVTKMLKCHVNLKVAQSQGKNSLQRTSEGQYLYHGTSSKAASDIRSNGFRPGDPAKWSLYGPGVYFSKCPFKCAQYTPRDGSAIILRSWVELGKSREIHSIDDRSWGNWSKEYDSVISSQFVGQGGPEYVIHDPTRAEVQYILKVKLRYSISSWFRSWSPY